MIKQNYIYDQARVKVLINSGSSSVRRSLKHDEKHPTADLL